MKKTLKILAIVTALAAVLSVCAFAAGFEYCADALNELGLFRGTQNGYELDREPTRAEAATMLVRLLGAEEEALALSYTAPFGDVADWSKPYVQYLYDKGLTKGTSETTFGYSDKCTAQQYATFLLRALGYSDGEDFRYDAALDFAEGKGLLDGVNYTDGALLRDNVVAMSYTALYCVPKSGEADLLTKLIADGVIDRAKGEKLEASFKLIHEISEFLVPISEAGKMSADMTFTLVEKLDGKTETSTQKMAVAVEMNAESIDKSKFSYKGTIEQTTADGKTSIPVEYYYSDGYMYFNAADMKTKHVMSFEKALLARGITNVKDVFIPVSAIDGIGKNGEVYNITISPDVLNSLSKDTKGSLYEYSITVMSGKVTAISLKTNSDAALFDGEDMVNIEMETTIDNIKLGDGVTVTLPDDLDTYSEESGDIVG